jgi:hypothetical protein
MSAIPLSPLAVGSLLLLLLPATSWAGELPPVAEQTAKVFGLDSFGQIEGIRFTFNAEIPGVKVWRKWEWNPQTDTVSYEGKDKEGKEVKATYDRAQIGSQSEAIQKRVDPAFLNDQYWLLLPLHVAWDKSATVTDEGMHKLPLADASAELIVAKYPEDDGYDPGDTWDLYVGADKRVVEMVYHRGGTRPPKTVVVTWAGYKQAGPLLVSTDHQGTFDGKPMRLFLTDVSVKVTGSDNWIDAK